jgi:hypothetical protein
VPDSKGYTLSYYTYLYAGKEKKHRVRIDKGRQQLEGERDYCQRGQGIWGHEILLYLNCDGFTQWYTSVRSSQNCTLGRGIILSVNNTLKSRL